MPISTQHTDDTPFRISGGIHITEGNVITLFSNVHDKLLVKKVKFDFLKVDL